MPANIGRPTDYTPEIGELRPSIYGLYDESGNLRYIGKANNPANRLASHMSDSVRRDTPVYRWIRKNGCPEMRVIEANCADWRESERRIIADARARGEKLLNVADGGDEPHCDTATRSANGKKSNAWVNHHARMKVDPLYSLTQKVKLRFPMMMKLYNRVGRHKDAEDYRIQMRKMAVELPSEFGKWANL